MYRFLKILFLAYLGALVRKRVKRALFPEVALQASDAAAATRYRKRKPYSPNSDRLWEEARVCSGYRIRYKSSWKNQDGEPVFYKKSGDEPWLVGPSIRPRVNGCYAAYPGGLDIDEDTGVINVNNSSTGIRYVVEFTPCGKDCVARTTVVIGGAFYQGSLVSLSSNEPLVAAPFYYGHGPDVEVPSTRVPASQYGYIPENIRPTANLKGLVINPDTGEIDIRATIKSGALGFRREEDLPANGSSKEFRVYYQLDTEEGKGVINYTAVRIHFFDQQEDIPDELFTRIKQQHNSVFFKKRTGAGMAQTAGMALLLGLPLTWVGDAPWDALAALLAAISSSLLFMNAGSDQPLRPPEHIVVK